LSDLLEVVDLHTEIPTRRGMVRAVDGVSLSIRAGETVGLVGESGSGKTMTGMSIMRLLPNGGRITGGTVKLDGRELTTLDEREMCEVRGNKIGVVFQDPMTALNPTMTIGDQIAEPVQVHLGAGKRAALGRATELLELVGMPTPQKRLNDYPYQLSGGLRQRAVIAMALACDPDLLIADEPTTALDVSIQAQILGLLDDLVGRMQMGMLLITHDMGVVADRTDRVMVMYAGQIVEASDTWTLFNEIRHPYAEALLDSIPHLEADRSKSLYSIPGMPPDLSDPPTACRFAPRCRYARQRCLEMAPVLESEDASHSFACFFPVRRVANLGSEGEDHLIVDLATSSGWGGSDVAPPTGGGTLLVVDHVVKQFPIRRGALRRKVGAVHAVSDVSLEVGRGETLGLVGESGSGKTTLGRLIMALEKPDSGSISFDGEPLAALKGKSLRRKRRKFQFVFQDPYSSLDPRMRVLSILREPLASQRVGTKQEQITRIEGLLHEVGLSAAVVDLYPHQFSGGQRQRIGLARALVLEPRLIVADEPVSALDVSIQSQVLNLMKSIQTEHSLTYVVISHDLSVVRYLADRIGVMYLGKLVEVGPSEDVYRHPAHPYTAGLLASIPSSVPEKVRSRRDAVMPGELPSASQPPSGCRFRTRCPKAAEICAVEEPVLRRFNESGHQAACHFPLETPIDLGSGADGGRVGVSVL
jgi:peptide/nickel transport system ATP-binding protein